MDVAHTDQILADVKQTTLAALNSRFVDTLAVSEEPERYDSAIRELLIDALLHYHAEIWPSSHHVTGTRQLVFDETSFELLTGHRAWEPTILELAYVPPSAAARVESQFGTEFPISTADNYTSVRIFPPRAAFAFEFHIDTVADIVRAVLRAGYEWRNPGGDRRPLQ